MKSKWVNLRDGLYDLSRVEKIIFHNEHKYLKSKKEYEYVYGLSITLIYPKDETTIDYKKQPTFSCETSNGKSIKKQIICYQNDPKRMSEYERDVGEIKKILEVIK